MTLPLAVDGARDPDGGSYLLEPPGLLHRTSSLCDSHGWAVSSHRRYMRRDLRHPPAAAANCLYPRRVEQPDADRIYGNTRRTLPEAMQFTVTIDGKI